MRTIDGKEIRAVIFDLDETILNTDKTISEENKKALVYLRDNGVLPIAASGRFLFSGTEIVRSFGIGLEKEANVYDGGGTIGIDGVGIHTEKKIEKETFQQVVLELKKRGFSPAATDGEKVYYEHDAPIGLVYRELHAKMPERFEAVERLESLGPMLKLVLLADAKQELTKLKDLERFGVSVFSGGPQMIEISNPEMNKWNTAVEILTKLKIDPHQTMAFGDSGNDTDILKGAQIGIAMKNGQSEAKDCADFITQYDNNHSGFAREIKRQFAVDF